MGSDYDAAEVYAWIDEFDIDNPPTEADIRRLEELASGVEESYYSSSLKRAANSLRMLQEINQKLDPNGE